MAWKQPALRVLRRAVWSLLLLLALVLLLLVVGLSGPGRRMVLDRALRAAAAALPGSLHVAHAEWELPLRLRLAGVQWVAGGDTVAVADTLRLALDVGALRHRHLHLRELVGRGLVLRLAAARNVIASQRVPGDGSSPPPQSRTWNWPLAPGSLPGAPSMNVDHADLDVRVLDVPSATGATGSVRARLETSLDLRREGPPVLRLSKLEVAVPDRDLVAQSHGLVIDLARGEGSGRIEGRYTAAWPFVLEVQRKAGAWEAALREPSTAGPPDALGAHLRWQPPDDAVAHSGSTFEVVACLPSRRDLQRDPGVAAWLRARLDSTLAWPRLRLRSQGALASGATPSIEAEVGVDPAGALRRASVRIAARRGLVAFEDLHVEAPGVTFLATGHVDSSGPQATVRARLADIDSVRTWSPWSIAPALERLQLGLEAGVTGPQDQLRITALLQGSAVAGGRDIPALRARGNLVASQPLRFEAQAEALLDSLLLGVALRGDASAESIRARVAPIRILEHRGRRLSPRPMTFAWTAPGHVRLHRPTSAWVLRGLDVRMPLGRVRADAEGSRTGAIRVRSRLEAPVEGLKRRLPPQVVFDGLGPLRVRAETRADRDGSGTWRVAARIDPTPTAWIGGRAIDVRWDGRAAQLDSVRLDVLGVELRGAARGSADSLRGTLVVTVAQLEALRRHLPAMPADTRGGIRAEVAFEGSPAQPDVRAHVQGTLGMGPRVVPRFEMVARVRAQHLERLRLLVPEGIQGIPVPVTRVEVGVLATADSTGASRRLDHAVSLDVQGPHVSWSQTARLRTGKDFELRTDHLEMQWRGRSLRNVSAFEVAWNPEAGSMGIEGLDLRGSLGRVMGRGFVQADTSSIDVRMAIRLPSLDAEGAVAFPWPDSLRAGVRSASGGGLEFTADVRELQLGEADPLGLVVRGRWTDRVVADARLATASGQARLQAHLETYPAVAADPSLPRSKPREATHVLGLVVPEAQDSLHATLQVRGLALPERLGGAEVLDAYLRGASADGPRLALEARIGGTIGRPRGTSTGRITFAPKSALAAHHVALEVAADGTRVRGALDWRRDTRTLVHADAESMWNASSGADMPAAAGSLRVALRAPDFDLANLDPVLPPHVAVRGRLQAQVDVTGTPAAPAAQGRIVVRDLVARLADGSLARGHAQIDLSPMENGTSRTRAVGSVVVEHGRLRIPDFQRTLAPIEGSSLLWELAARDTTGVDFAPPVRMARSDSARRGQAAALPVELAITVKLPQGITLRGNRMEVEVEGALDVELAGRQPVVVGTLTARRGQLELLGQRFEVRRGEVTFYGGDVIDPTLDLTVGTRKGDVDIRVHVEGTALRPRLTLESDPPMAEADIFTYLLFGKEREGLDSSQNDLLRAEASRALQRFTIPRLERELGAALGLDVVRIGRSAERPDSRSLLAGKYLSSRALLSYEQSLEESDSFFVSLRYRISTSLSMESRLGRSDPSSIVLNWSKDY